MPGFSEIRNRGKKPEIVRDAKKYYPFVLSNQKFFNENKEYLEENPYYQKEVNELKKQKKKEVVSDIIKTRTLFNTNTVISELRESLDFAEVELMGITHSVGTLESKVTVDLSEYSDNLLLFKELDKKEGTRHYERFYDKVEQVELMRRQISEDFLIGIDSLDDKFYEVESEFNRIINHPSHVKTRNNINYINEILFYIANGFMKKQVFEVYQTVVDKDGVPILDDDGKEQVIIIKEDEDDLPKIENFIDEKDKLLLKRDYNSLKGKKYKGIPAQLFYKMIQYTKSDTSDENVIKLINRHVAMMSVSVIEDAKIRKFYMKYYDYLQAKTEIVDEIELEIVILYGKDNPIKNFQEAIANRGVTVHESVKGSFMLGVLGLILMVMQFLPYVGWLCGLAGIVCVIMSLYYMSNFWYLFEKEKRLKGFDSRRDEFTDYYIKMLSIKLQMQTSAVITGVGLLLGLPGPVMLILVSIGLGITTYIHYVKSKQIDYLPKIEEDLAFSLYKEVWSPENSTTPGDKDEVHYGLGKVKGLRSETKKMSGFETFKSIFTRTKVKIDDSVTYYLRAGDMFTHTINLGGTGSGKTALAILPLAVQFILNKATGMIVVDPKGDLVEDVYSYCLAYQDADEQLMASFYRKNVKHMQENKKIFKDEDTIKENPEDFYKFMKLCNSEADLHLPADRPILFFDPVVEDCPYINITEGSLDYAKDVFTEFIMSRLSVKSGGKVSNSYFQNNDKAILDALITSIKFVEGLVEEPGDSPEVRAVIKEVENEYPDGVYFQDTGRLSQDDKLKQMITWLETLIADKQSDKLKADHKDKVIESLSVLHKIAPDSMDNLKKDGTNALNEIKGKLTSSHVRFAFSPTVEEKEYREEMNIGEMIKRKGIMLITTRQGQISPEDASFLAMGLIFKIQKTLFEIPLAERQQCQLVIDEFQTFANRNMDKLFNQGRSYKVAMHAATQSLESIQDDWLRDIIFANTFYRILHQGYAAEDKKRYSAMFGSESVMEVNRTNAKIDKLTGLEVDNTENVRLESNEKDFVSMQDQTYSENKGFATVQGRFDLVNRVPYQVELAFTPDWVGPSIFKKAKMYKERYENYITSVTQHDKISSDNNVIIPVTGFIKLLENNQKGLLQKDSLASKYA